MRGRVPGRDLADDSGFVLRREMRLFVSNIHYDATELDLRSLFAEQGFYPDAIKLCTDRITGAPRGFAFVEFQAADEAGKAVASLDGWTLLGRRLNVQAAREEPRSRDRQTAGGTQG
jgi:RNA recognition motif-containing protein